MNISNKNQLYELKVKGKNIFEMEEKTVE